MNYRNKTIFDWNNFVVNSFSSNISLKLISLMKEEIKILPIRNVIIRDINDQIGIILQIELNEFDRKIGINYFKYINELLLKLNYKLKLFAIQCLHNKKFDKNYNIDYYKKDFIEFETNYLDKKIICLLPNSFFQVNISVLPSFYNIFIKWIKKSNCENIINIGDDGGNICTILSSLFKNMITYFHCNFSLECCKQMIKLNNLDNFYTTDNIKLINQFDQNFTKIILFINPGRKGLRENEIAFINQSNIKNIVYMACNDDKFRSNLKNLIKFKIIDSQKILNMPDIGRYEFLYFLEKHN